MGLIEKLVSVSSSQLHLAGLARTPGTAVPLIVVPSPHGESALPIFESLKVNIKRHI